MICDYASGDKEMLQCLELVTDILKKEHCKEKGLPFTDEIALNLDEVEKLKKKGVSGSKTEKTVDMVLGLCTKKLLLVEIKLDCKSVDDISRNICAKIDYSKKLLSGNPQFIAIEQKFPVILKNDRFEQNKNKLKRKIMAKNKDIEPCKVIDFYNKYF